MLIGFYGKLSRVVGEGCTLSSSDIETSRRCVSRPHRFTSRNPGESPSRGHINTSPLTKNCVSWKWVTRNNYSEIFYTLVWRRLNSVLSRTIVWTFDDFENTFEISYPFRFARLVSLVRLKNYCIDSNIARKTYFSENEFLI